MNSKPRILILTDLFPNKVDKIKGICNLLRADALREDGCEVKIVAPIGITPPERFLFPLPNVRKIFHHLKSQTSIPNLETIQGFHVIHPKWFWLPRRFFWKYELELLHLCIGRKMAKVLRDFEPDVVLTSWLHPFGTYAKHIKEKVNVPVITIAEGDDILINPLKYSGWSKIEKILNQFSSSVICVSKGMHDVGAQRNLKPIRILRNAYNDRSFFFEAINHASNNDINILSVGSLDIVKGHDILLKAMLKLDCQFKLTLVGNGPLSEAYHGFIDSNGLNDRIKIVRLVENHKLRNYQKKSHLFCMPSRSEGFPLAPLEALATGLPVVASNVGGLAEMIIDDFNGYLFKPQDVDDLTEKLLLASKKNWDRKKIASWAKDNYSLKKWANEMLELIDFEICKINAVEKGPRRQNINQL